MKQKIYTKRDINRINKAHQRKIQIVTALFFFIWGNSMFNIVMFIDLFTGYEQAVKIIENRIVTEVQAKEIPVVQEESTNPAPIEVEDHISTIVHGIYTLESSQGINNYSKCEAQGKYNGYGYGIPDNGNYICFDTHGEATATVYAWVEKKIDQGFTLEELLCIYNTGKKDSCEYYNNYMLIS